MTAIRARTAQIIGRDHLIRQANRQDAHALLQNETFTVAVLCDGCGEGEHSEIGATLAAQFLAARALEAAEQGVPLAEIPARLHKRLLDYLCGVIDMTAPPDRLAFIQHHLLFTVLGVIARAPKRASDGLNTFYRERGKWGNVGESQAVIFAAGDGLIAVDDEVTQRDEGNAPRYPAYHLLAPDQISRIDLPAGFAVQQVMEWERLALASDGFEPALLPEVWNAASQPRALQRRFNLWSNEQKRFKDDATLITLEWV